MAKKVMAVVKLQIPAGKANPAPPVGPALGQHGVNIMGFCKEFNERTQDKGLIPQMICIPSLCYQCREGIANERLQISGDAP